MLQDLSGLDNLSEIITVLSPHQASSQALLKCGLFSSKVLHTHPKLTASFKLAGFSRVPAFLAPHYTELTFERRLHFKLESLKGAY